MKNFLYYSLIAMALIGGCTPDRDISPTDPATPEETEITAGTLKINEFVAKGSTNVNENGSYEDWVEIYNTTNETLTLEASRWFVTDDLDDETKSAIPQADIPAKGFLVIWCDKQSGNDIHADFALSGSGESIGIFYLDENGDMISIDELDYDAQSDGVSYGRFPDGSETWEHFNIPTPGTSNND